AAGAGGRAQPERVDGRGTGRGNPVAEPNRVVLPERCISPVENPRDQRFRTATRRHSQVVRQRSAKPSFPGSNPGGASPKRQALTLTPKVSPSAVGMIVERKRGSSACSLL